MTIWSLLHFALPLPPPLCTLPLFMSPLQAILATYCATAQSERERGTYLEELIRTYFR